MSDDHDTTIECIQNGPYIVKGLQRLVGDDGDEVEVEQRIALCRCGGSGDKPFCDGTHKQIGFASDR